MDKGFPKFRFFVAFVGANLAAAERKGQAISPVRHKIVTA
jgi:hypothetical protein